MRSSLLNTFFLLMVLGAYQQQSASRDNPQTEEKTVILPSDTPVIVRFVHGISSKDRATAGIELQLAKSLVMDNLVLASEGATVKTKLDVGQARSDNIGGFIQIEFVSVESTIGEAIPLQGKIIKASGGRICESAICQPDIQMHWTFGANVLVPNGTLEVVHVARDTPFSVSRIGAAS